MIRMIAAIDQKRGIATDNGIPWKIPADSNYYKWLIKDSIVVMAYGTYKTHKKPLSNKVNYVLTHEEKLRQGFEKLDLESFKSGKMKGDVWIIGGESIFKEGLGIAEELYLTLVDGDFDCTKFFPEYSGGFKEKERHEIQYEGKLPYTLTIWERI